MKVALMQGKTTGGHVNSAVVNSNTGDSNSLSNVTSGSDIVSSPKQRYVESMNPMIRRNKDLFRAVQDLQQSIKNNENNENSEINGNTDQIQNSNEENGRTNT